MGVESLGAETAHFKSYFGFFCEIVITVKKMALLKWTQIPLKCGQNGWKWIILLRALSASHILRIHTQLEPSVVTSSSDDKNSDCILSYFRLYN